MNYLLYLCTRNRKRNVLKVCRPKRNGQRWGATRRNTAAKALYRGGGKKNGALYRFRCSVLTF